MTKLITDIIKTVLYVDQSGPTPQRRSVPTPKEHCCHSVKKEECTRGGNHTFTTKHFPEFQLLEAVIGKAVCLAA